MNEYTVPFLRLPGTMEEQTWLAEHLETLSVRESIILAAAVEHSPPETMADAVNNLLTLGEYEVLPAGSYEQLGALYLQTADVPNEQRPAFDKGALGWWYANEHPGTFLDSRFYVSYPEQDTPQPYNGNHLPTDLELLDWSVRLKLASPSAPEGLWLKLPDSQGELDLAREALGVNHIEDSTLLEERCILPCVRDRDIVDDFAFITHAVYEGDRLGDFLKKCKEEAGLLERFLAALEYESCQDLGGAAQIAEAMDSYDVVEADAFLDRVTRELNEEPWAKAGEGIQNCFDYAAYAEAGAAQQGYSLTHDGRYYIRKSGAQELGMTMQ